MNLQELQDEVQVIVRRPDLAAEIKSAVKAATLKLHHLDYFPKDLREVSLAFSEAVTLMQIEYASLLPDWRALAYLRPTDASYSDQRPFFTVLTPDQTVDTYQVNKENIVYLSGQILQLRACPAVTSVLLGYYAHPNITDAGYNSWIAREYPYAIVYDAAAKLFKKIGLDEQAGAMMRDAAELATEMRNSNVVAVGY